MFSSCYHVRQNHHEFRGHCRHRSPESLNNLNDDRLIRKWCEGVKCQAECRQGSRVLVFQLIAQSSRTRPINTPCPRHHVHFHHSLLLDWASRLSLKILDARVAVNMARSDTLWMSWATEGGRARSHEAGCSASPTHAPFLSPRSYSRPDG